MDTIKRQDAAEIVLNRLQVATIRLLQGEDISDVLSKTQSEILTELLLHNIKPAKQLHPFCGADEISHLKGGTIIGIVDADSNDPDSDMTSDCLIIEIEKDGELHELAFQDGEWFTLSFKSAEEEPAEHEKRAQPDIMAARGRCTLTRPIRFTL